MHRLLLIFLAALLGAASLFAQTPDAAIRLALDRLQADCADYGLTPADVSDVWVSSAYASKKSGVTHVYFNQMHQGVEVLQAAGNANISREGALVNMNVRFVRDLAAKISSTTPTLAAEPAVRIVAAHLEIDLPGDLPIAKRETGAMQKTSFEPGDYALEPIQTRLAYHADEALGLRLVWEVLYYETSAQHHWNALVDALTGDILVIRDMVLHCDFGSPEHADHAPRSFSKHLHAAQEQTLLTGPLYNVFPMPIESPSHGPREIVSNPSDPIASPFGWHDTDGVDGADWTITRGNNVHAYQDASDNNDSVGDEPDGGADLHFDFPYEPGEGAASYQNAAVTNLFYWCNVMHDVWYQYGFDEPAGNFQFNNYGNGGEENDYIRGEAQDGSGTNNANFSSSADGSGARIQMYLWTGGTTQQDLLTINSPANIAGGYIGVEAGFGSPLPNDVPITADLVLVDDGTAAPSEGCQALVNGAELTGKIALVDRGNCPFVDKVLNAQNAGAIAVIVCNNADTPPIAMGGAGGGDITVPSIMISKADCELIKAELANGVVGSLLQTGPPTTARDGDFDSGIVCHEYGHGVSIRLTGGPGTGGCLGNAEQMGEGWSDYIGMILTMEAGDTGADIRGVGTFAIGQPTTGVGIRPAPYSTDFDINPYTYAATNDAANISQPHGVGFVWATMLWDMTWLLIDQYGFDPDFYNGEGGNNIAMQLVTEGMKLQPCNPGFVDGRDAILLADQILYGGANQCLIWDAFARRGLGKSASQGSSGSRTDQVEAFDVPNICIIPDFPPKADFSVAFANECTGVFAFQDMSTDVPHTWFWDFGDGNTSTEESPSHTYAAEGDYVVMMAVFNTLGSDTLYQTVSVDFIDTPIVDDVIVSCEGAPATLTALDNGYTVNWYLDNVLAFSGLEFITPPLTEPVAYMVESEDKKPLLQVGPADNSIGGGGYHNSSFTGTIIFEAHVPFILESVWVDAGAAGNRVIELFDMSGNVVNSVTVFMPAGQSIVTLNLEVSQPGMYQVGGTNINLYRNNTGAQYPYVLEGVATLLNSSATSTPQLFYYYLYDWKVRELSCFSEQKPVFVTLNPAPTAAFSFEQIDAQFAFTDASAGAISWLWDFGDGNTSTDQNPAHTYFVDGEYVVTLTVSNGLCETSSIQTIQVVQVSTHSIEGLSEFRIYPSIGNGEFTVSAILDRTMDLELSVANVLGQTVYQINRPQSASLKEQIRLPEMASGLYLVKLKAGGQQVVERYVLVK